MVLAMLADLIFIPVLVGNLDGSAQALLIDDNLTIGDHERHPELFDRQGKLVDAIAVKVVGDNGQVIMLG